MNKFVVVISLLMLGCSSTVTKMKKKKSSFDSSSIKKYSWGDLDVTYVQDERLPVYSLAISFADGSLADGRHKGITNAAFNYLSLGTRRYSQKDIADNLEFFAVEHGASVTHENVTYSVSGLVKDIQPTMKMICHLFDDADYPKRELKSELARWREATKNMVNDQGALASHLFRELSLRGTPLSYPVSGKLKDIKKVKRSLLKKQLDYFNKDVKKHIYLSGPKSILSVENVITKECGWTGQGKFVRKLDKKPTAPEGKIVLVTVPQSNQAQVRIGKMIGPDEFKPYELLDFAPGYLGGGFTSRLMRVLRTKEGLVYSVWARASAQKNYGRSFISTSTKNNQLEKLLTLTKGIIADTIAGQFDEADFKRSQGLLAAGFPFRFERSDVLLAQLMDLDHKNRSYNALKYYQQRIYGFTKKDLMEGVDKLFNWDQQTIFVLGTADLQKTLKKFGPVEVISYKKLL